MVKNIGGKDPKKCVNKIMGYLFHDNVLEEHTYKGKSSIKNSFKSYTEINKLIESGVRAHYARTTSAELEKYISDHIRYAKCRLDRVKK